MNKELIDRTWSVLPKEFKEEVKKLYSRFLFTREGYYDELFGKHNLISDAEGEEMLCVSRKRVQEMYAHYNKISNDSNRPKDYIESVYEYADGVTIALDDLFGSKCLPDEEPKPAEPKYKVGDKVRIVNDLTHDNKYNGESTEIVFVDDDPDATYKVDIYDEDCGGGLWYSESDLEPYTEPKKESRNLSQETANCDKCNGLRLHIAAMAMQGILGNADRMKSYERIAMSEPYEDLPAVVARNAVRYANALIAEAEKGGADENS